MNLRPRATSVPVLQVLLQLSLLLTVMVSSTIGETANVEGEHHAELGCMCTTTTSGIHPRNIQNLKVFGAGPHCSNVEVIATLKNGKEICLDPNAPVIKKIVQKILEGDESAA
uniref:Chemokine interleukin-8-like domain-containing protein n=1 Tax=Myotis lucifugus TaxID=59463 RepID=G1PY17_MYOLU